MTIQEADKTNMLATSDVTTLAHQLRDIRHDGRQILTDQLISVPSTVEDAIKVQNLVSKLEGADVSAWKVAKSPHGEPVAAPLYPYIDNPAHAIIAWRKGMKIEAEIAVMLRQDLPVRTARSYERAEIVAAISEVYLGVELVWSGISEGGGVSFLAFLADRLGNAGYVRGSPLSLTDLQPGLGLPLKVWLNKQIAFSAAAEHPTKDVLTWLCDYANERSRPVSVLRAGSIVTTGSLCGAIEVTHPGDVFVQLGEDSVITLALS